MPVRKNLVLLADGHQNKMPFSMDVLAEKLKQQPELQVVEYFHDYSFSGAVKGLLTMIRVLPLYAQARYVFICDSFLPVSYCRKRKGTTVVQLWHSCGLMKKVGADSAEERKLMSQWQHRNYDVFTTSSADVSDILSAAMNIPRSVFTDTGISRMDIFYNQNWIQQLHTDFYRNHPQYCGKKIILWAPTFRGTPQTGFLSGKDEMLRLQQSLPEDYALIIRTHRFAHSREIDTPISCSTESLLALTDILITDYSSIYYDYTYFRRPIILFAPDLEEYQQSVGMYIDYESLPGNLAKDYDQLYNAVLTTRDWANNAYQEQLDTLWKQQMAYCDGHSTENLLHKIGILSPPGGDES